MECPKCKIKLLKNGHNYTSTGKVQRYKCPECGFNAVEECEANRSSRTDNQWELIEKQNSSLKTENGRLKAFQKTIIETVERSVVSLPTIHKPRIPKPKTQYKEETSILLLSDFQLGSFVDPNLTARLAYYNKEELKKRADLLIKKIYECVDIQRKAIPLRKLKINVLGDIVQGEDVFKGQGFSLDALMMEQVFQLGDEVLDRIFLPLAELYEDIEIFCVPGNHGKAGGKHGTQSRQTNWDYIVYWLWKQRLQNIKHVKFYISAPPFLIYELYPGQNHALIHGQQARSYMGYPYYGIDRMYKKLTTLSGLVIHFLYHGHHHQPHTGEVAIGEIIGNGSFEGGSCYSVNDLLTANKPEQFFFGMNEHGKTWEYKLRLAEYTRLKPDENGIYTTLMFQKENS